MDTGEFSTSLSGAEWEKLGTQGHEIRTGDAERLERLNQSAYACEVLSRLLIMSDNADAGTGDNPLNGNIVGGLHHALHVIADSMQANLYALARRTEPSSSHTSRGGAQ